MGAPPSRVLWGESTVGLEFSWLDPGDDTVNLRREEDAAHIRVMVLTGAIKDFVGLNYSARKCGMRVEKHPFAVNGLAAWLPTPKPTGLDSDVKIAADLGYTDEDVRRCIREYLDSWEDVEPGYKRPPAKDSHYPHECPRCKGPAYIGFSDVDCKRGCK